MVVCPPLPKPRLAPECADRLSLPPMHPTRLVAALLAATAPLTLTAQQSSTPEEPQRPEAEPRQPSEQDPVRVTAPRPRSDYAQPRRVSVTRGSIDPSKTPGGIQVVPEQVIQDQGIWRLKDVYRNVSSVQPVKTEGFAVTFEDAFVRGFQQRPYLDGGRTYALGPIDLAALGRIEVLKGPASLLYGAIEPGGVINLVPKLPTFESFARVQATAGSYDYYRGQFDVGGVLDEGSKTAYRVAGSYQNSGSFRDSLTDESIFLAPSFAWDIAEDTRLTAWMWLQHLERPVDDGVAFSSAGNPVAPIETFLGDPNHNTQTVDDAFVGVKLEHDISDDVMFRQEVQLHYFDSEMDAVRRFGNTSATQTVAPFYDAGRFDSLDINSRTELVVQAETASIRHEVLTGVQVWNRAYTFERRRDTSTIAPIPIVDPVFPNYTYTINNSAPPAGQDVTFAGAYVRDHMSMLEDRLHVLAGVRVEYILQDNSTSRQEDVAPTWQAGVLYELTDWVSPYGNISTSYSPTNPNATTLDGGALDPETGVQYEVGAKFQLIEDRLAVTTAVYQIDKEDVSISDPVNPGFAVNGGNLRSRGFEFDGIGTIVPGLQLIGSYAYTDTEVVQSDSLPVGGRFRGIPLHSGSVWLKYDMQPGLAEGFGAGIGVFGATDKAGDNNDTFELAGYTRVDVAGWYRFQLDDGPSGRFQLNVLNALDEEYYESSFNVARVQPGQPLSLFASLSLEF